MATSRVVEGWLWVSWKWQKPYLLPISMFLRFIVFFILTSWGVVSTYSRVETNDTIASATPSPSCHKCLWHEKHFLRPAQALRAITHNKRSSANSIQINHSSNKKDTARPSVTRWESVKAANRQQRQSALLVSHKSKLLPQSAAARTTRATTRI